MICGIDPGKTGAIVFFDLKSKFFSFHKIPLTNDEVDFKKVYSILKLYDCPIYLERAIPFAMGSKGAFNYGRDFSKLEIAILLVKHSVTYVEPAKWAKVIHEGIMKDMKPKAKSIIALKRLLPKFLDKIPKNRNGKYHDGIVDALLIAYYGNLKNQ